VCTTHAKLNLARANFPKYSAYRLREAKVCVAINFFPSAAVSSFMEPSRDGGKRIPRTGAINALYSECVGLVNDYILHFVFGFRFKRRRLIEEGTRVHQLHAEKLLQQDYE